MGGYQAACPPIFAETNHGSLSGPPSGPGLQVQLIKSGLCNRVHLCPGISADQRVVQVTPTPIHHPGLATEEGSALAL